MEKAKKAVLYKKSSGIEAAHSVFDGMYKRLNAKQRVAVDAIEGPVMVMAGPGTGKTTVLTLRIANILRRTDTPAHGILAITYTDAGVKAMRDKLRGIIGDRAHDVRIHTFHSFAASVIAEYPDHFIRLEGLKQMSGIEQETMIRDIISAPEFAAIRPAGKPDAYVSSIIRAIDDAKREALTPEMVESHAKAEISRIENDEDSVSSRGATKGELKAVAKEEIEKCKRTLLLGRAYAEYEKRKMDARQMDFNDLIIELLVALRNDELLLRLLQERFLYIHVDEHQDTNDAQNFIVALIAEFFETPNIFIVGDEKQAIYRFQGASVENFLLLRKRWPLMQTISLDTNYRSHQSILDAGFTMIEKNYDNEGAGVEGEHSELRVKLVSKAPHEARPIDVVQAETVDSADAYLVREIKSIRESEPESTIAIIARRNRELDRVIRLLESNRISVSSERSIDIFDHPIGSAFFDLIEAVTNRERTDLMARTFAAGLWELPFEESAEIIRDIRSLRKGAVSLGERLPALASICEKLSDDDPLGFIVHAAKESGLVALISHDPVYAEVWRGIAALSEALVRDGDIKQPRVLVERLLAYRLSAESRPVKVSVGAPDAPVKAMTAHGSKGLEFDYVFLPYATEEAWVGKPRGSTFVLPKKKAESHDIRDLRRLFYVAITRAKKHVSIVVPEEESDGRALSPVRFIAELGEKCISRVALPKAVSLPLLSASLADRASAATDARATEREIKVIDYAKRMLVESGLSVTALNHFLESPKEFIYESILKLPQAPSVLAEKGSAMHEALSRVWMGNRSDQKKVEETLLDTVVEYLDKSLLPVSEKELVRKELVEDIPAIAKALMPHFGTAGSASTGVDKAKGAPGASAVYTEHWVKSVFEGQYDGKPIRIPIHGKLDAIIDNGKELFVFDYKTRKAMSVNAIKGETKSSLSGRGAPGAYFRQLVFYKMLLKDDLRWREKRITPALVFVSPDEKGRCPTISLPIEQNDIAKVGSEIQSLIDSVWSGDIARSLCG